MRSCCFLPGLVCLLLTATAQEVKYAAAEKYDVPHLRDKVGTLTVLPFFFKNDDRFWFNFEDSSARHYYFVDPKKKQKGLLFNRTAVAAQLTRLKKETIDTAGIDFKVPFNITAADQTVTITYKREPYRYNFYTGVLMAGKEEVVSSPYPKGAVGTVSPDKKWQLFARSQNLVLQRIGDSAVTVLSTDAAPWYSFGVNEGDTSRNATVPSNAVWLPDSKRFYIVRQDNRLVGTLAVVHSLSWPRPRTETYKYQLPGDKYVTQYELYGGDVTSGKLVKINTAKWPDQELEVVPVNFAANEVYFLRKKRTRDEMELCAGNLATGEVRVIIHETCKPYISEDRFQVSVINNGNDILWWSERTGWGHYYLYSGTGTLKNAITAGDWTAGKILYTDSLHQALYLYGYGREAGRNPYFAHLYKVSFDGKKISLLTPENATHNIYFAPTGRYFVDNYSTINTPPKTVLRNSEGRFEMEVAHADVARLYAYGWRPPEPFRVKAADGVTDLYGIMWKPFDFDASRKYPVISQVYPGPQIETVWPDFTVFDKYNNAPLAQLGCIVVCMGHRGGSPYREKKYAAYQYGNLRDAPLADDKHGLEQLAKQYPFIDLSRVGIFGHSGGAMMSTAAICTYPDFYKVAVASSGNHDNTIYNRTWGETYQGIKERTDTLANGTLVTTFPFTTGINQTLAKNLKGRLLLVTGETDTNVHPGNTLRMADALIKAGRDFDMLVLPEQAHHYEGVYKTYFENKLRHYFGTYLLGGSNQ